MGKLATTGALAVNNYDPGNKLLTLDAVQVGSTTYRMVTVVVNAFDQLTVTGGAPGKDSFDPATNILRIGNVNFESNTYTNVPVRINGYSLQGVGSDAKGYLQNTVPTPTYAAGSDVLNAFNYLNSERARCGFGNLVQNSALDRAALAHATYEDLKSVIGSDTSGYNETPGVPGFTGVTASDRAAAQGYQTNSQVYDAKGVAATTYNTSIVPGTNSQLQTSAAVLTRRALARRFEGLRLLSEGTEVGFGKRTRDSMNGTTRYVGTVLNIAIGKASDVQGQTPSLSNGIRTYPCQGSDSVNTVGQISYESDSISITRHSAPIFVVGEPGKTLTIDDATITAVATGLASPVLYKRTKANDPDAAYLPNEWTGYIVATSPFRAAVPYRVDIRYTSGGVAGTKTFTFTAK